MKRARIEANGEISVRCPGCGVTHSVNATWTFNGDVARPTFSPSLLVTNGHFISTFKPRDSCWCTYNAAHPGDPSPFKCNRCHSFVNNGRIQFLTDSTHELAGQTVDLAEFE